MPFNGYASSRSFRCRRGGRSQQGTYATPPPSPRRKASTARPSSRERWLPERRLAQTRGRQQQQCQAGRKGAAARMSPRRSGAPRRGVFATQTSPRRARLKQAPPATVRVPQAVVTRRTHYGQRRQDARRPPRLFRGRRNAAAAAADDARRARLYEYEQKLSTSTKPIPIRRR